MTSILRILSILALLALWFALSLKFPPTIVPGPAVVAGKVWENIQSGQALLHLSRTLFRVFLGLILTMVLGIAAGAVMGLFKKGEAFLDAWITVGLTIPAIVYSIICLLWFGLTERAAILAIGLSAFPTVAISV
jgi:NitT/TauT family transport system permease protein